MSRCCGSSTASTTTRIRWRWYAASSRRCRPSITTAPTSEIRTTATRSRIGSSQNCPRSRRPPTSTRSASRSSIRRIASTIAAICCTCSLPCRPMPYEVNPVAAEALDLLFILHADHEQNCSTSTVRLAGSSGTNPYSAIAAGMSALWGPAHGGANEAVINMLEAIGNVDQIGKYIAKAKDKNDSFRLMGFGHRVYKSYDPRAAIIRKMMPPCAREARPSQRSTAVRARPEARGNRAQGSSTSSRRICTRTWTSIPESSIARSGFRSRCSP